MGLLGFVGRLLGVSGTPSQKIELSKSATAAGLPIIYGKRRTDAITVLKRVSNRRAADTGNAQAIVVERGFDDRDDPLDHNNWLHRIDVWGQGPIEAIDRFWIDGDAHTHTRFASKRPYFRAVSLFGEDSQNALTGLSTAAPQWSANHRGLGVAYSWTRFFNSTQHPQYRSEPQLRATVRGLQLYDPRKDPVYGGVGSHSFSNPTSWSYSNNRALVVLNYMMGAFGFNAPADELDMASFQAAADVCDQTSIIPDVPVNQTGAPLADWYDWYNGIRGTVPNGDPFPGHRTDQVGTSQARYAADAVIDPKDGVVRNIKTLLEEFGWSLSWANGKHRLVIEDVVAGPVMALNEDDILGGWTVERGSRSERLNRVTVQFPNANKNFEDDTVSWPSRSSAEHTAFLAEDGGRDLHTDVTLKTVTDHYRAKAYAEFYVRRSRVGERITGLQLAPKAMLLEPGDVIAIDFADKGYTAPDNRFIVERVSVSGTLEVSVDLRRYDATVYGAETPSGEPLAPNDDNADAWADPDAITNLGAIEYHTPKADGSVISGIYLSWDAPASNIPVERIEVKWRDIADAQLVANDDYAATILLPPEATACRIPNLTDNQIYHIVVSYVTRLLQRSIEATLDVDLSATVVSKLSNIEEGATDGATIGTNLFDHDGFLVDSGDVVTADGQLTMGNLWDFKWSALGWTPVNMTVAGVPQGIHVTPTTNDGQLLSPDNLNIDGAVYDKIAVRMKRVVQGVGDFFEFPVVFYETDIHAFSGSYKATRSLRFGDSNARTFVFDMANLTAGGDDWVSSTIKRIRFDPSVTLGDTFEIDWIGVGRVSAPAQEAVAANLADEIQFADIAPLDTDSLEVFGKVELADTSLQVGDQVSVGCEIIALDNRRGRLEVIFERADLSDIAAYTSPYVNANTASYQRTRIEGLTIPPNTALIRYRLLREQGLFGAVGGRRPSLNKGPRSLGWYTVRGDVQQGANNTTDTSQLTDSAGLGSTALWTGITGSGKPVDGATKNRIFRQSSTPSGAVDGDVWVYTGAVPNVTRVRVAGIWRDAATRNTGDLADLDSVSENEVQDGAASDRPSATDSSFATHTINGGVKISNDVTVNRVATGQLIVGRARFRLDPDSAFSVEDVRLELRRGASTEINVLPLTVTDNYYTYAVAFFDKGTSGTTTYHLRVSSVGNVNLPIDVSSTAISALVLKR